MALSKDHPGVDGCQTRRFLGPRRTAIRRHYDRELMDELFGAVNVPPQVIEAGIQEIQPVIPDSVSFGFFARALRREAL